MQYTLVLIFLFCYVSGFINCVKLVQNEDRNFVTLKPGERHSITIKKYKQQNKPKIALDKTETKMNATKSYEVFEDVVDDIPEPFYLQIPIQYNSNVKKTIKRQTSEKENDKDTVIETAESRNYQIKSPHGYEVTEEPENLVQTGYSQDNYINKKPQIVLLPKPNLYTKAILKPFPKKYGSPVLLFRPFVSEDYRYKPIRVKVLKPYIISIKPTNEYQKPILIKVLKPQSEYITKQLDSTEFNAKEIDNDLYGEDTKNPPKSYQVYKSYEPKTVFKYFVDPIQDDKYKKETEDKYIYYYNEKPKPWKEYVESNKH